VETGSATRDLNEMELIEQQDMWMNRRVLTTAARDMYELENFETREAGR
jgi:hypothetical protein